MIGKHQMSGINPDLVGWPGPDPASFAKALEAEVNDSRSLCRLYPHQILALVKAEADGLVTLLSMADCPSSLLTPSGVTRADVENRLSEIVRLTAMLPEVLPR